MVTGVIRQEHPRLLFYSCLLSLGLGSGPHCAPDTSWPLSPVSTEFQLSTDPDPLLLPSPANTQKKGYPRTSWLRFMDNACVGNQPPKSENMTPFMSATHKTSNGPKNRGDIQYPSVLNIGNVLLSRTHSNQQSTSMLHGSSQHHSEVHVTLQHRKLRHPYYKTLKSQKLERLHDK